MTTYMETNFKKYKKCFMSLILKGNVDLVIKRYQEPFLLPQFTVYLLKREYAEWFRNTWNH